MRGLSTDFPWTELQRLQNLETAAKTAQRLPRVQRLRPHLQVFEHCHAAKDLPPLGLRNGSSQVSRIGRAGQQMHGFHDALVIVK